MIEYGLLASKSSEIFSSFLRQLGSIWDSIPLPVLIVIAVIVIVAYYLIRTW